MKTFYDHQASANLQTAKLLAMFTLAALAIWLVLTFVVLEFAVAIEWLWFVLLCPDSSELKTAAADGGSSFFKLPLIIGVGVVTAATMIAASWYRIVQLRSGGGKLVALELGGRLVDSEMPESQDQRIANIVEELALAAEMPVPPVYMLDKEAGINAFAAGHTTADAVVALTHGCVERLNREQLQGVVAHELGHILSGDIRRNIDTIGVLHGILFFDLLGQRVIRFADEQWGHSDGSHFTAAFRIETALLVAFLMTIGISLIAVGFTGALIGAAIQAAMNRQREFHADARATEFTRNPIGLASALKVIAGYTRGSRINHPAASEFCHLFFNQEAHKLLIWLSTHPPVEQRIVKLQPDWNGEPEYTAAETLEEYRGAYAATLDIVGANRMAFSGGVSENANRQRSSNVATEMPGSGFAEIDHLYHVDVRNSLPASIKAAFEHPAGLAVTMCALLDDDQSSSHGSLQELLQLDPLVGKVVQCLSPVVSSLDHPGRLMVLDEVVSRIRETTDAEIHSLRRCTDVMLRAGDGDNSFRWAARRMLTRQLAERAGTWNPVVRFGSVEEVPGACQVVLSALVHGESNIEAMAEYTFMRASAPLECRHVTILSSQRCSLAAVDEAVEALSTAAAVVKRKVMICCGACVTADQEVSLKEASLLRGICSGLNFPLATLLPGQPVAPGT